MQAREVNEASDHHISPERNTADDEHACLFTAYPLSMHCLYIAYSIACSLACSLAYSLAYALHVVQSLDGTSVFGRLVNTGSVVALLNDYRCASVRVYMRVM